jgi:hypothetical protein
MAESFFFLVNYHHPFPLSPPKSTDTVIAFSWLASSIRTSVCPLSITSTMFPDSSHVGYTVVFKNDVTEETVMKYMADVVEAGGRLTQTYDWFLNVRIVFLVVEFPVGPALTWNHRRDSALLFLRTISSI